MVVIKQLTAAPFAFNLITMQETIIDSVDRRRRRRRRLFRVFQSERQCGFTAAGQTTCS